MRLTERVSGNLLGTGFNRDGAYVRLSSVVSSAHLLYIGDVIVKVIPLVLRIVMMDHRKDRPVCSFHSSHTFHPIILMTVDMRGFEECAVCSFL
jgi:hypothetical protein